MDNQKIPKISKTKIFVSIAFIVAIALFSIYQLRAPKAKSGNIPANQFSTERALEYLQVVANKPHHGTSAENKIVGDYILKQLEAIGVQSETQATTSVDTKNGYAMPVRNIIATMPGTNPSKTLLFMSHYDSAAEGPGASDNGVAVASQLETIRALKNSLPLENNIIFLFEDGEESGQGGANAFVEENPLFNDVDMVFNYEARGVSGPVLMFETTPKNSALIYDFAKSIPNPMAFSYLNEIYNFMPNTTDFTFVKDKKVQGLNFAFPFRAYYYHTALDNIGNASKNTIEHEGQIMLGLANYFGKTHQVETVQQNSIYSNVLGIFFFHYTQSTSIIITLILSAVLVLLLVMNLKRKIISIKKIVYGFLVFLLATVAATGTATIFYLLKQWLFGKNIGTFADTYLSWTYFLLAIATSLLILVLFYGFRWIKKIGFTNLAFGAFLIWLALTLITTFSLPGLSCLFVWPLFFGLIIFEIIVSLKSDYLSWKNLILILILSVPAIVLYVPFMFLLFAGLGTMIMIGIAFLASLLFGLFISFICILSGESKTKLPILALSIVALFCFATFYTAFNTTNYPRISSVAYIQNFNTGKAYWLSIPGQAIDKYIAEYMANPRQDTIPEIIDQKETISDAPWLGDQTQDISVVSIETNDGTTTYNLKITDSSQQTNTLIFLSTDSDITKATLIEANNKSYDITDNLKNTDQGSGGFGFENPPADGINISIEMPVGIELSIQDVKILPIPVNLLKPRPSGYTTSTAGDTAYYIKTFKFNN